MSDTDLCFTHSIGDLVIANSLKEMVLGYICEKKWDGSEWRYKVHWSDNAFGNETYSGFNISSYKKQLAQYSGETNV